MIDDKNAKIIKILQQNARTPYTKIAKKLGITETAIRKRVSQLKKRGVIEKFTVVISPKKLGYSSVAQVGIDLLPENFLNAVKTISSYEEVKELYISSGDHMIVAEVWAENQEKLNNFISEKINTIEGVKKVCPAIILEKVK